MKIKTLTALSALALMTVAPAYAEAIQVTASSETTTNQTLPQAAADTARDTADTVTDTARDAGKAVTDTAKSASDTLTGAGDTIRAAVIDEAGTTEVTYVNVDMRMTAKGMLDKAVYNTAGATVGNVDDIILSDTGDIKAVVVSHGGFLGLGAEQAAFDYNVIMRQEADGDVIIPVSEDAVKQATPFVYEQEDADAGENVQVMAATDMRVSKLLDTSVKNAQGTTIGEAENIILKNGKAEQLILTVDEGIATGEKTAALKFGDIMKTKGADGNTQLQLSATQAAQLEKIMKLELSSR